MSDGIISSHIIGGAMIVDGSGEPPYVGDVLIADGLIAAIGAPGAFCDRGVAQVDGTGQCLAPGFIDVHTHDDLAVIERPDMMPKISQGVTTVIVGNCGISAGAGMLPPGEMPPDPMALLGSADCFRYADFASYARAVDVACPSVNVAALVGHTALRAAHMDRLDRAARPDEIVAMRADLEAALAAGAIGLSTGLAYGNAAAAPTAEVLALAEPLAAAGGVYCTHLRSESAGILDALDEAFAIGRHAHSPVIVSHLKCAGVANQGRSGVVLAAIDKAAIAQQVGCDCYPYTASSSTLDLKQVDAQTEILITWSVPCPDMAGRTLAAISDSWGITLIEAAKRLQPAGAIYHCMAAADVERILAYPATMIGSDGLPEDPLPHPRLWGAFPRVLGHYVRERGLFPIETAIRKMTGLSADRFGLTGRGYIRTGHAADLILFDPATIADAASYSNPTRPAHGINAIWVNGIRTLHDGKPTGHRAGRFLPRGTSFPTPDNKDNP